MNRFRKVFVYLLIIAAVVVILSWAVRPSDEDDGQPQPEPAQRAAEPVIPAWARWPVLAVLFGGWVLFVSAYVVNIRRARRDYPKMLEELARKPVSDISGVNQPPEKLANLFRELEAAGYRRLGEYSSPYLVDRFATVWVLVNSDGTIRALGMMPDWADTPSITLSSIFRDDAIVESRYSSVAGAIRTSDYRSTNYARLKDALNGHAQVLTEFRQRHGEPISVSTIKEYIGTLKPNLERSKRFLSAVHRPMLIITVVASFFALAYCFLLLFSPDAQLFMPVVMGSFIGLVLMYLGGRTWYTLRKAGYQ